MFRIWGSSLKTVYGGMANLIKGLRFRVRDLRFRVSGLGAYRLWVVTWAGRLECRDEPRSYLLPDVLAPLSRSLTRVQS